MIEMFTPCSELLNDNGFDFISQTLITITNDILFKPLEVKREATNMKYMFKNLH